MTQISLEPSSLIWRKSNYSGDTGGHCVEVAELTGHVGVRDSKHPERGHLRFTSEAWTAFLTAARSGHV